MQNKSFFNKKTLLFVFILLLVLFSPFVASKVKERFYSNNLLNQASADYYAVFLDNSQVYFGKMVAKSSGEIILANVYYLQANAQANASLGDQHFTLIKLGQELHGPTDEMMINMSHVVFYEKLRADSQVVKSIKGQ